jgi:hypothetical protein
LGWHLHVNLGRVGPRQVLAIVDQLVEQHVSQRQGASWVGLEERRRSRLLGVDLDFAALVVKDTHAFGRLDRIDQPVR